MKVKQLLSDKSKWIQNCFALTKNGHFVSPAHKSAAQWCLAGAVEKCYQNDYITVILKIRNSISPQNVVDWNDSPYRKFSEVKALIELLDI